MKAAKGGLFVLMLLLGALVLAGCGGQTKRITIGVRTANDHAPFYLADRQQLYQQHGLAVEVRLVASNTEIIEALQRGDLQMGAVPVTTAIAAIAQGHPLHIVAMTGRGSDGLLVRREDGPQHLAALRGHKIATIRASILDVLLRQALELAGLDPERDVELVYMDKLGDLIAALKTGQVMACSNTEPFLTDAERQGWGRILTYYTAQWPDHPCCVVVARDDFARRNPQALRQILAIHVEAVTWANEHPQETAQVIAEVMGGFDPALVRASLDRAKMRIDYHLDPAEIRRMADLMVAQGLIAQAPDAERLVNLAPLRNALEGGR
jgi:NitT/TauT family transport system substrate-binding protein